MLRILLVSAVIALSGCKTLEGNQSTSRLIVTYAALKYVETHPSQADRVRAVAEEIKALASGESIALASLQAAAMAHVAEIASPADRMLATELVNAIAAEIAARTEGGVLSGDTLVYTRQVMDWIIAAMAYVPVGS